MRKRMLAQARPLNENNELCEARLRCRAAQAFVRPSRILQGGDAAELHGAYKGSLQRFLQQRFVCGGFLGPF
ncbi:hypothetical protein NDU88_002340 [Pleurodeles waltl]|uniref:Uncharacterized protein n=1 Tax=Pleurodeles waltl TaxID=8319 RepID=A0AAV7KSK4_PLEWA|nr:hypothetical protein NDU88_002340 [Pleurodeles waltl]